MTTTPTPDPITAEIAELVPLMEKAGIMPERMRCEIEDGGPMLLVYHMPGVLFSIDSEINNDSPWWSNFLHILRGTAEDWLRGRGWNGIWPGSDHDREYEHDEREYGRWYSLPAALAAEIEKGVG